MAFRARKVFGTFEKRAPEVPISIRMGSIISRYYLFSGRLFLVVNGNNEDPTCSLLGSEPIRSVVVIRPNLIGP